LWQNVSQLDSSIKFVLNVAVPEVSFSERQHAKQVNQAKVSNFWWYDLVLKGSRNLPGLKPVALAASEVSTVASAPHVVPSVYSTALHSGKQGPCAAYHTVAHGAAASLKPWIKQPEAALHAAFLRKQPH
jgi:hypothetical protein